MDREQDIKSVIAENSKDQNNKEALETIKKEDLDQEENIEKCDSDETKSRLKNDEETEELDIDELLGAKIKLNDGSEHFIFSRGPKYSDESWPLNCHLCRMGNLITKEQIKFHVNGKRHLIRLEKRKPDAKLFSEPFFQCTPKDAKSEIDKQIKIYPGEIIAEITPELEDRIIKPDEFEVKPPTDPELVKKLTKEYVHEYNEKLPVIGLCYMYKMNGYRGLTYYCTLCSMRISANAFKHVIGEPHQMKYIIRHFPKLYDKVVERLSRVRALDVRYNVRNVFRKLYRKIENAKGFRKITIVDDDDFFKNLKKYALKTRFDVHYDENTIPITEHEVSVLIRKCINGMEFIRPDNLPDKADKKASINMPRSSNRGKSPSKRRFSGHDFDYDWQRYHDFIQREVESLNAEYQEYDRYPSSHSRYSVEENKFFVSRKRQGHKKEVIRRDWQRVWRQHLREMYDKDLVKRKFRVKKMLRLPLDVRTPSPSPPRMRRSADASYNYNNRMYADHPNPREMEKLQPPESSGPLGVISCLRLLTALEDQLGSLGPKAVLLLSRAVVSEKNGKNPNDLMMENDYYVFFVTAKEKMKGQLFANIIDSSKTGAVTRAIQDCTTLLEMFESFMRRQGKPMPCSGLQFGLETVDNSSTNQYSTVSNQYNSTNNGAGSNFSSAGSYGNNYSTGSGGNGLNNYNSGSGTSLLAGSGSSILRGGSQGGIWQNNSFGNQNMSGSSHGYSHTVNYPSTRTIPSINMSKWQNF